MTTDAAGSNSAELAVDIRGLVRRYGSTTAVDGLDLTVAQGSLLTLLGPNGAGKTTTLSVIEGLAPPDDGSVRVLGFDPWRDAAKLRPKVGVMLQAGGAHLSARTAEVLNLVARCSARPLETRWLLDILGLAEVARTPVRRLSGGQIQRLSFAMALVGRPELLILDEPTAGMDPQARSLVWEAISAARRDGVTILLTTHLLDEAELLSDQIVIIDAGQMIAAGSPAELVAGTEQQLSFSTSPALNEDALRAATPPTVQVRQPAPGHFVLTGEITPALAADVTALCATHGVLPTNLRTGARTLTDVYLDLTGRQVRT